jgi:protease-4
MNNQPAGKGNFLKALLIILPIFFVFILVFISLLLKGRWGNIGLIEIKGPIYSSREYLSDIKFFEEADFVKGVLIRLETPGGSVGAVQEIYQEVLKLSKKKPVVASMGNISASGGYYIACAANKIFANPGTLTGSIGVIFEYMNLEGVLQAIKVKPVVFKSGKFKDAGSPFRKLAPEEEKYLQGLIDELYLQFRNVVKERRGLTEDVLNEVANGKVFTGESALKYGLIDAIGTMGDAIDELKKMTGIKKEKIVKPPKRGVSFLKRILGFLDDESLLNLKWDGGFSYKMVLP